MARPHGHRRHQRVREAATARYAPTASTPGLTGILLDSDVIIETLRGRREISDAIRAIAYLSRYARTHGLEIADALIAAAAATGGLRLWTLNRRHYPMTDLLFYEPPVG